MKKKAVKSARRVVKVKGKVLAEDADEDTLSGSVDGVSEERGREVLRDEGECMLPCPLPRDPAMGDKTPEVMAWYREHRPEEFMRRYGNRVCPEVGEVKRERCGTRRRVDDREDGGDERGPVSDFEDEDDEVVMVKPRVIMG